MENISEHITYHEAVNSETPKGKMNKYYRCNKCGQSVCKGTFKNGMFAMCTEPMPVRTSGICGGSISVEISKKEYNEFINKYQNHENKRSRNSTHKRERRLLS